MKLKAKTIVSIGLTGGIASGKSIIAKWLEQDGYEVVYADKLGHEVLTSEATINDLKKSLGDEYIINGQIDRKKLGELVFKDKSKLELLNEITHPHIRHIIQERIEKCRNDRIIVEIPLLFESKLEKHFDSIILIWSDKATRINRITHRDKISEKAASNRIESQKDDSYKIDNSDYVIENNASIETLRENYYELKSYINCINDRNALPFYQEK